VRSALVLAAAAATAVLIAAAPAGGSGRAEATPAAAPFAEAVSIPPAKKSLLLTDEGKVVTALSLVSSPIQVVPIMATSGVARPAIEVISLSWAVVHGSGVIWIVKFGFWLLNVVMAWLAASLSPSSPLAHTWSFTGPFTLPVLGLLAPHAAISGRATSARTRNGCRNDLISWITSLFGQPQHEGDRQGGGAPYTRGAMRSAGYPSSLLSPIEAIWS